MRRAVNLILRATRVSFRPPPPPPRLGEVLDHGVEIAGRTVGSGGQASKLGRLEPPILMKRAFYRARSSGNAAVFRRRTALGTWTPPRIEPGLVHTTCAIGIWFKRHVLFYNAYATSVMGTR